jgi:hypothetical protein
MRYDRFDKLLGKHLAGAEAAGVHPAVIATLDPQSRTAQAAYTDFHGRPFKQGEGDYTRGEGLMVTWTVEETTRVLRRHGGLGGSATSNLLEAAPEGLDFWWLALCQDRLFLVAFRRGASAELSESILRSCAFFDRLPFAMCACCARSREAVLAVSLGQGMAVPMQARTRSDAGRAAGLVQIVARRGQTWPTSPW